ncbi:MAG: pilin [Patescibacteria group bacterium]|nr:pilin [Patescibacteria group bacterium]
MNKKILIILLFLFLFLIIPIQSQAGLVPCGSCEEFDPDDKTICLNEQDDCTFCDIFVLVNNILILVLTRLVPIIATVMLVWGGFMFFSSVESPGKVEDAKNIIKAVIIGMVIIFVAWVFLNSFLSTIGVAKWAGLEEGWWEIQCD